MTAEPNAPVSFSTLARYRLALICDPDESDHPPQVPYRPGLAARTLSGLLSEADGKMLGALFLDTRRLPIGHSLTRLSSGTCPSLDTRSFFATALMLNAASLVLFHRHGDGDLSPSQDDLAFTARIRDAGEVLGIRLVDHLILGTSVEHWQSLRQHPSWFQTRLSGTEENRIPRPERLLEEPLITLQHRPIDGRSRVQPKYRDPATGATWSGRGRMARWLRYKVDKGESAQDYLIERH